MGEFFSFQKMARKKHFLVGLKMKKAGALPLVARWVGREIVMLSLYFAYCACVSLWKSVLYYERDTFDQQISFLF